MTTVLAWFKAARLRTLPLSISGILVGTALSNYEGFDNSTLFVLLLLTAVGFQITSNFSNDYGDGVKGIDNDDRIGPKRVLQSGLLSREALKKGIVWSIVIDVMLVVAVLYTAFGIGNLEYYLVFFILGLASIWAAIRYTVGEGAYGYRGMGDFFVFIFFGLLAVLGTFFLYAKTFSFIHILPASTIGLLSAAVLNLNNLRDFESDKKSGKNTLIVKMGVKRGKHYHNIIVYLAFICMIVFCVMHYKTWIQFIPLLAFIPIVLHLIRVQQSTGPEYLDPELKKLALSTFLLATLFYICYNNFL